MTKKEDFARDIAAIRSKGYPAFNYGKKNFSSDIESSFAAGQTNANEVLLNNYLNKIYPTLSDILIGIKEMYDPIIDQWDQRYTDSGDMVEPRRYAQTIVALRYKQADNIKMPTKNFIGDLESAYVSGQKNALQFLLKQQEINPYGSSDEILGDIHVLLAKSWSAFRKNHMGRSKPLPLDKIIEEFQKSLESL